MNHQPIKNIIFDLGGVLLNINYALTEQAFVRLEFDHFSEMYSQFTADALFERLETGHVGEAEFYKRMLERAPANVSEKDITQAWNAMLLDFRIDAIEYVKELRKTHRLFLLSNTNAIHFAAFQKIYIETFGQFDFDSLFEKAWYSHIIGYRKPHPEVYEFVLGDAGITAGETLFIDDSYPNIEASKKLGIQSHLLVGGERIQQVKLES